MRKRIVLLALCFGLAAILPAQAETRYLLESNSPEITTVLSESGLKLISRVPNRPIYIVSSPSNMTSKDVVESIGRGAEIQAVEPDSIIRVTEAVTQNAANASVSALAPFAGNRTNVDYYGATVRAVYANQSAAILLRLAEAHLRYGLGPALVAVIDTGVDVSNTMLANALEPGYDFVNDRSGGTSELFGLDPLTRAILSQSTAAILDGGMSKVNPSTVAFTNNSSLEASLASLPSAFGHGTMVAGLIHLVAPKSRILPLKAFGADGTANTSDIVRAIYYAVDHGAKVINMSFSIDTPSDELKKAIDYATTNNVVCVAAAGNSGSSAVVYPAAYSFVIGVGSTTTTDVRSAFSNFNTPSAKTAAPGEGLITTYPGNLYAGVWGTSFSAALVTGAVAILADVKPGIPPGKIAKALEHGKKIHQGMGEARLDVLSSVSSLFAEIESILEQEPHE